MKTPTPICLLTIALLAALLVAPALSRAQNLYISNPYNSDTVGEYDSTTGAPISGFTPPSGTTGLALSGNNLYVSSQSSSAASANTIGEYNATTGAPISGFSLSPSGLNDPFGLALSGNDLFVANFGNNTIGEYNATTGAAIPGFTSPSGLNGPFDLVISGNDLYVANSNGTVGEYNLMTGAPIPGFNLSGLGEAVGLALSGNGSILYVSTYDYGTVGAYNATTGAPIPGFSLSPTGLSYPEGLAVSGNILYVVNNGDFTGPYGVGAYNATTGAAINPSLVSGLLQPQFIAVSVPEPSPWSMIAVGGVALLGIMHRRKHRIA